MYNRNNLFSDGELSIFLREKVNQAKAEIKNKSSDYILNVDIQAYSNYLVEKYSIEPLTLLEDEITVTTVEKDIDVSQDPMRFIDDRSRPVYLSGTEITYYIPFRGTPELFRYKTSTFNYSPPKGVIRGQELWVSFEGTNLEAEDIKRKFENVLVDIKKWLGWVEKDLNKYTSQLITEIEEDIKSRREKLLKANTLVSNLDYPLKEREGMPKTYAVPEVRRKISPEPIPSGTLSKLEPVLSMNHYEHILGVVNNMTLVMERSPQAFKSMDEESIRQNFLVQLNGHYEGQATGETFNYQGKTDILIRVNDKNIFIAECKF